MRCSSLILSVLITSTALMLPSCATKDRQDLYDKSTNYTMQDRDLGYDRDDYRNAMRPRPLEKSDTPDNIPDMAPVISQDKKNILPQPLVSISVNQDVPIRDIFYELAKQAEVDLELDPTITGSIIFTAHNSPFDQVINRICDMAGLRYKFKNNVLRVERDTPYTKTYHVDYLSMQRDYDSEIKSDTSASTGGGGSSGGGSSNGSKSSIKSKSSVDFWAELDKNITQIMQSTNKETTLTDQSSPITIPQAIPAVTTAQLASVAAAAQQQNANTNAATAGGNTATGANGNPGGGSGGGSAPAANGSMLSNPNATPGVPRMVGSSAPQAQVTPPAPVAAPGVTVPVTAPTAGLANPSGIVAASSSNSASSTPAPYFSISQQAGLITVFASEKQHEKIQAYLDELLHSVNTQVLIEAKVFEVTLNDDNRLGIDWSAIKSTLANGTVSNGFQTSFDTLNFADPVNSNGGVFSLTSGNLNAVIKAISRFGTVRALSSPRLSVMNNQTAVLNVSQSRVFFKLTIQRTDGTNGSPGTTDVTSEVNNVPEGLIITVHPSINADTNEITMNLRPSITRVVSTVNDPAVTIAAKQAGIDNLESPVPQLSTREIDSVVKMHSGKTIIMGGLMQDRAEGTQESIPLLGDIPVVGNLFRNHIDSASKTEMVIMLRATVVGNSPKLDDTDKDMYTKMGQDRHPFNP